MVFELDTKLEFQSPLCRISFTESLRQSPTDLKHRLVTAVVTQQPFPISYGVHDLVNLMIDTLVLLNGIQDPLHLLTLVMSFFRIVLSPPAGDSGLLLP